MESGMVNNELFDNKHFLGYKEAKEIILSFLNKNMPNSNLCEDQNYGMYFLLGIKLNCIRISLTSDRGDLTYRLFVDGREVDLNNYEPLLKNLEWFSKKNIEFLLSTIKSYLESEKIT